MTATPDLLAELRRRGVQDVDGSVLARALYTSDASLYRVVPQVVVRPRAGEELLAVLDAARVTGVPLTMRGAGTSIAGNAVGPGIVVDTSRHLNRVLSVDPEAATARVEPGAVADAVQLAVAGHGLRFGPDPSTHTRCTVGGMIGNNACGSRALGFGRTVDNVAGLSFAFGTGEVVSVGPGNGGAAGSELTALVAGDLAHVRTNFGRFSRQVSGYALEHLLPEGGPRVDRFLVGSEGTLGIVLDATVELVRDPPHRLLLVLGYGSMAEAADAVPAILGLSTGSIDGGGWLLACEGLDARIVDLARAAGTRVPQLPRGAGWLFVEIAGETAAETRSRALRVADVAGSLDSRPVEDVAEARALWRIREDGAGLAALSLAGPAYSGWEDAAVPPQHLGAWLRDFDDLLEAYGLDGVPYGHFGDGCVHVRIDFALDGGVGQRRFREFLVASATKLQEYGGSLSGEHGDGRARSELLPLMYDERSLRLFGAVKAVCDPDNLLNPGVLVDPDPVDASLRAGRPVHEPALQLRLVHDGGSLASAVHRCTGVGRCVAATPGVDARTTGGVMCPSYLATRDESASTRGRARVLQEALDGTLVDGLADPAVEQALDLCLACKGCASDCPTGVDMATYKAEVAHQQYAGRRRPRSHYALGRLPMWLRLARPVAPVVNGVTRRGPLARLAKWAAGVDQRRTLPNLATDRWSSSFPSNRVEPPDVWIWGDSFTRGFSPGTAHAAIRLLESAGLTVGVIEERACCGLTWFTTGQLPAARRIVERAVATLHPYLADGTPVVGLEPSCLAALRSDAAELTDDPRAAEVARGMRTLAEVLTERGWQPPDLTGVRVVAQPHCHHSSVLGWAADEALLRAAGADLVRVGGCCGLAGNFGMEKGHYEVSVAVAETALLPAVRAHPDAIVLADGMSCRTQLDDLEGVPAMHLAELFLSRLEA